MLCQHLLEASAGFQERWLDQAARCPECAALGRDDWVHLRLCLTCGHVACCDSSPSRHASAHHRETDHPVMRSFEPGETWRWCFVDRRIG